MKPNFFSDSANVLKSLVDLEPTCREVATEIRGAHSEVIAFSLPEMEEVVPMDCISQESYLVRMKNLIGNHIGQYV